MGASFSLGCVMLAGLLPPVGLVVGSTVLWDAIDPITMRAVKAFNRVTANFNARFVKQPQDAFLVNAVLLYGVLIPSLFFFNMYMTMEHGLSLWMVYIYHVLRIGPYFMNFAYVYTLCHKEGHSMTGMWAEPWNPVFRNVFNWWCGLFFGIMPSSFAYGHTRNHHKYTNSPRDVVTTGDRPRDNFSNFIRYIPRFGSYAVNISTVIEFYQDRNYPYVFKMIWGSLVYWAFFASCYIANAPFAMAYVLYPLLENTLILSAINWCWHAFIDPHDPDNEFAISITLLDGPKNVNVLNEDYHVVHHQYPAYHWTENPKLYQRHMQEYRSKKPTMFRNTHVMELFFLIILKEYKKMAAIFIDLNDKMTLQEKEQLIIGRLRAVSWGPLFNCKKTPVG